MLSDVAALLLKKINVPVDEIREIRNIITNERAAKMFETLDYDVQETRRQVWQEAETKFREEVEETKRRIWQETEKKYESQLAEERKRIEELQKQLEEIKNRE